MQADTRVGVVVEGGKRGINSSQGGVAVDGGVRELAQQQHSDIGTVSQLLAGGVAGALSKTCTAPLARLTILFQVQGMHSNAASLRKASIWNEASRIVNEEGFRAFWKGNLVTIAHRLPYSSVNFYAYEHYKKFLKTVPGLQNNGDNISADVCIHFVGGGLAGITAATGTYPLDLVRTRLAAQTKVVYYRGIWHALRTISKEEGLFGLYKGLGATLLGVGPSIAISFSVYETLRSFWQSHRSNDSTVLVSLACGSLSGIASSTGEGSKGLLCYVTVLKFLCTWTLWFFCFILVQVALAIIIYGFVFTVLYFPAFDYRDYLALLCQLLIIRAITLKVPLFKLNFLGQRILKKLTYAVVYNALDAEKEGLSWFLHQLPNQTDP